jgi:transposase
MTVGNSTFASSWGKGNFIPFQALSQNRALWTRFFIEITSEDKDVKRLIKRLKRHRKELFTFLEYKGVSPYNNYGEQQMRKPPINRKISHQNRSNTGAKAQAILMTLFRSAELQRLNPIEVILTMAKQSIDKNAPVEYGFKMAA